MSGKGFFITFEGGEGVGKSTLVARIASRLQGYGYEVLALREPGSTEVGEQVRSILLDPGNEPLDPAAELLLYESARAQMVGKIVAPAVAEGKAVLCDRFTDSTVAYQGYARGLGVEAVEAANRLACGGLVPDRTILLERDFSDAMASARAAGGDRMEMEPDSFHEKVRSAFREIASKEPDRIRVVEVSDDESVTEERVLAQIGDLIHGRR